jgi:DNA-binding response OmpR family regulator
MNTFPILLVEDDENDIFFFERAYKKAGITNPLHIVRDGDEAIQYLSGKEAFADREKFPLPSLIVLDLNLPLKHGLEVLKWLREKRDFDTLVVVVLTSSQSEMDMRQAYKLGANSYLVKPSDPDKLTDIARLVSDYWLRTNQAPREVTSWC